MLGHEVIFPYFQRNSVKNYFDEM